MTAIEMTLDLQAWSLVYLIRSHGELHSQKEKKSNKISLAQELSWTSTMPNDYVVQG